MAGKTRTARRAGSAFVGIAAVLMLAAAPAMAHSTVSDEQSWTVEQDSVDQAEATGQQDAFEVKDQDELVLDGTDGTSLQDAVDQSNQDGQGDQAAEDSTDSPEATDAPDGTDATETESPDQPEATDSGSGDNGGDSGGHGSND